MLIFLSFYLNSNSALISPPLSTVLGNIGVKTKMFCDYFNKLTKVLPVFLKLRVYLRIVFSDKKWDCLIKGVSLSNILKYISVSKDNILKSGIVFGSLNKLNLSIVDLFLLGFFYFFFLSKKVINMCLGVIYSMGIFFFKSK